MGVIFLFALPAHQANDETNTFSTSPTYFVTCCKPGLALGERRRWARLQRKQAHCVNDTSYYRSTCTGLPESALAAKLVVYPNPTRSDLNIALPLSRGTALILRLFDAKGQKVYEQQYPKLSGEFKQVVSLKNKSKGVYLLQLILDDGVVTKRVVVE